MVAPDLPVHLDEALLALDSLHANLRGVQVLRLFLEALNECRPAFPLRPDAAPPPPLEDFVAMENAYALGARCLTLDGDLIVIPRVALLELLRKFKDISP